MYGANVIIFEGILAFHDANIRKALDMKVQFTLYSSLYNSRYEDSIRSGGLGSYEMENYDVIQQPLIQRHKVCEV